jgi:PEP-CTERM motif
MKRNTIATVLGVAGLVCAASSSFGQGTVAFDNYDSTPYYPIVYGSVGQGVPSGIAGTGAGANVSAELGYFIGTFNGSSTWTLLPATITSVNPSLMAAPGGVGTPITGYFQGPAAVIPGYTSGPISFEIVATTTGYSGTLQWVEPSIATLPSPAGGFTALPGETVLLPVPEPATLALAGLGGLATLVGLRRKQS